MLVIIIFFVIHCLNRNLQMILYAVNRIEEYNHRHSDTTSNDSVPCLIVYHKSSQILYYCKCQKILPRDTIFYYYLFILLLQ